MRHYTHELTEIDHACGVTLEAVARELERGVFRENGTVFVVSEDASPAVSSSTARAAFGGLDVEYSGRSYLGRMYRPIQDNTKEAKK